MKNILLLFLFHSIIAISAAQNSQSTLYWRIYNQSNSGIPSNCIFSVTIDDNEKKWISTSKGIGLFSESTWDTLFPFPNFNSIKTVRIDAQSRKWIGSYDAEGLAIYNDTTFLIYTFVNSPMPNSHVQCITIDTLNTGWIGTADGLAKFDGYNNWSIYKTTNSGIIGDDIWSIAIDNQNNKWIGTSTGLCKFDGTSWIDCGLNKSVQSIAIDSTGIKWIGTTNGLIKYNDSILAYYLPSNSGLPDDYICSVTLDKKGGLWIGTFEGGLVNFDGINWIIYNSSNSELPCNWVQSITIDEFNNKWISTYLGGLAEFNESGLVSAHDEAPQGYSVQIFPNPVINRFVLSCFVSEVDLMNPIEVFIYDIFGRIKGQYPFYSKQINKEIDATNLLPGIYFVSLNYLDRQIFSDKFIKL